MMVKSGAAAHRDMLEQDERYGPMLDRLDPVGEGPSDPMWLPREEVQPMSFAYMGKILHVDMTTRPVGWNPSPMSGGQVDRLPRHQRLSPLARLQARGSTPGTGKPAHLRARSADRHPRSDQRSPRRRPARARPPASTSSPALAGTGVSMPN